MSGFDIDHVLGALTLDEKAALVSGADLWHTVAIERLGVPSIMVSDDFGFGITHRMVDALADQWQGRNASG